MTSNIVRHLIIPDTQQKPGVGSNHLRWLGQYIVDQRPSVIVHLGDHYDLPSLSSYDKGTVRAEGKRLDKDIEAGKAAMRVLQGPLEAVRKAYKPRKVFLLGNHEHRIKRHVDANPELIGTVSYKTFGLEAMGWEVHDFLKPVVIDGITYVHYVADPMTGRPYTGKANNVLVKAGKSFVMGHRQGLDVATRTILGGQMQIGIIAGSFYSHKEYYKGYQGNNHWRGIIVLNNVRSGYGDVMPVSLGYLKRKYGQTNP